MARRQYVIRAISGNEQDTAADLMQFGIEATLPLCKKLRRLAIWRRHKEVIEPVLPRYLFAEIPPEQYHAVKDIKFVVDLREMNRRDEQQLSEFLDRVERGDFNHQGPYGHLRPGEIMQMVGGLFQDLHMSFKGVKDGKIIGDVELMGQTVSVEVPPDDVEIRQHRITA